MRNIQMAPTCFWSAYNYTYYQTAFGSAYKSLKRLHPSPNLNLKLNPNPILNLNVNWRTKVKGVEGFMCKWVGYNSQGRDEMAHLNGRLLLLLLSLCRRASVSNGPSSARSVVPITFLPDPYPSARRMQLEPRARDASRPKARINHSNFEGGRIALTLERSQLARIMKPHKAARLAAPSPSTTSNSSTGPFQLVMTN